MKRSIGTLLIVLVLLSACSAAPQARPTSTASEQGLSTAAQPDMNPPAAAEDSSAFVVVDALGREVTFHEPPTRIVFTGKGLIMTLDAAYLFSEAPARIVGMGNPTQGKVNFIALIDSDYDSKVILETDAGAEQVAALKPDLVILKSYLAETVGKPIEVLNIPVVYVDFETPEQYTRDLATLGKIFQNGTRAQELIDFYHNKVTSIQTAVQDAGDKPDVLLLYYSDKDGVVAFNVPPTAWIQTLMVAMAGGEPVWRSENPGNSWVVVNLEQIAAWDADQIYIISYTGNSADIAAALKTDPQWQALRAVQQGSLYGFPADLYSWDQPDTRWILGLSWLAAHFHPDRFPQYDAVQEAQQFYQQLYGLDSQFFAEKIYPTFRGDIP